MFSTTFLILVIFHLVSSDRLRFHLENLVEWNVSPCDDFYHHACSQSADPNEFFINRVQYIFKEATERLKPDAIKNSPIEFDLQFMNNHEDSLSDNDYGKLVRERCKENLDCYLEDQAYYSQALREMFQTPNLTNLNLTESMEIQIDTLITETSAMIDTLITTLGETNKFLEASKFHTALQIRIRMIELMKSNSTYGDLHEIKEAAETMKKRMIENIENSTWLHSDDIGNIVREKIEQNVDIIQIFHDFDEFDKNTTTMLQLNRDLNSLYYSNKRNTGARGLDIFLGLKKAFSTLNSTSSPEIKQFIERITFNFGVNAFYADPYKSVTFLAPYMLKPVYQSDIMKEPIITYSTLSHEIYHSLFQITSPTLLALYGPRTKCIIDHFEKSCEQFGMDACNSGNQTITEDACDLEGLRMTYSIVSENYNAEDWIKKIAGLNATLEQVFFYYAASENCEKDTNRTEKEAESIHSAGNIRVNGALSLMPEFTKAFGCQKGDAMYVEEKDSCYVFGSKSK